MTHEQALWACVAVAALVMRIAGLGAAPLTAAEAREATLAWRAATGQGMPVMDYSPVLLAANTLLFTLFGAGDAVSRLLSALFGVSLGLTPILFRRQLGRVGALASGLYLAICPTGLVVSRQLGGTAIASAGAVACLGGLLRFSETEKRGWLSLSAIAMALGVTTGAAFYGIVIPLGLAVAAVARLKLDSPVLRPHDVASRFVPEAPRFFLTFAAALLLLSTGLGWNLSGLGASGHALAEWLGRFRSASDPAASPLTLLAVYEPWAVVFGLAAVIWGVQQRDPIALLLGLWAGLALLLLLGMPGRTPTDSLWVALPLAMLLGLAVETLVEQSSGNRELHMAHGAIALILWGHAYLMFAGYVSSGSRADLALAMIAVTMQGLVALSFGLVVGWRAAFRALTGGTALVLLALTVRAGCGVAYVRPADPREAILSGPTPVNVRDLVQTLEAISWQETGMPRSLTFTLEEAQDPLLAWYLRDFQSARRIESLGDLGLDKAGAVAVTVAEVEMTAAWDGVDYAGQDFPLRRQWTPRDLGCGFLESGCRAAYKWLLFRDAVHLPEANRWATVWRSSEFADAD